MQPAPGNPGPGTGWSAVNGFRTVALETLGCKVNQYESAYFRQALKEAGYRLVSFREPADIYLVHGCAVTARAAFQARQLLRRAQRLNPDAAIVAAGCHGQLEAARIVHERLATHILDNRTKFELVDWLQVPGDLANPVCSSKPLDRPTIFSPLPLAAWHSGRARALLKVQDGCNAFCAYCVVPHLRGRSRSLSLEGVCAQMARFLVHGCREVVLTGIHLGQWGKDLDPPVELATLMRVLNEGSRPYRIRLSSLEPMECTSSLLTSVAGYTWLCPHFHVPLQSGDADVLARMGRPYTPQQYAERIWEIHRLFPRAALGADVMVGFPGESAVQFANTCDLIRQLPLSYLHAFPFSPRPGTAAESLPGRLPGQELKRRVQVLRDLSRQKKQAFQAGLLGRTVEVLAETEIEPGWWRGTSENYLQVVFPASGALMPGFIARVTLEQLTERGMLGKPLGIAAGT